MRQSAPRTGANAVAGGAPVRLLMVILGLMWLLVLPAGATAQPVTATVTRTQVDTTITPVIADHITDGLRRAERNKSVAYLVELDTPGGLDASMREIVQSFLDARVPVIVYVSPSGARAASAGSIITSAAHIAAMSPGTSIGAATPVDARTGEPASEKVINDAAAYAETVAAQRGRNTQFAIDTVREGRSVTDREAVAIGAVDLVAPDQAALLAEVDGREVTLANGTVAVLHTSDATVIEHEMGPVRSLLQFLSDPNLAFLFLSIGTLALIYELATPGVGLGGVIGVVMLVLAFFALSVLPVSVAGLLLLALAVALLVAELFAPGIGVFAAGGAIALLFAGLFLFEEGVAVNPLVLLPTVVLVGVGVLLAGRLAWRARRSQPVSGVEAFLGREFALAEASGASGRTLFEGSWWNVHSSQDQELRVGQLVRVVGVEGLTLVVEPVKPAADEAKEKE